MMLVALAGMGACDLIGDGAVVVELEEGEVTLPEGASSHEIRLEGVVAATEIEHDSISARAGDALVFVAGDALTHSIMFLADSLQPAQVEFLRTTSQLRSPPLLTEGARWVVSLAGAPAGTYPFACVLHGGRGRVVVAPSPKPEA